ncbi:MAG TPA: tetraacyldisaccharide 4'-kinase [Hyphomicrobiaceae bacterium]|nr:tetraacyldisaccharide 4'-kinase [Hyphomicrobiaceae bacterium]
MRLDEPSWWYDREPRRIAAVLQPLAALYGRVASARYFAAAPYRSRLPVICVGNFTAGGTGKTPLVLHLCRHLKQVGHEPIALTRGYGGRLSGPYWVDTERDMARDVGDETLLLAETALTVLARDRRAGARAIEIGPHPATVILMDDGLQNPSLAKDLTIAVVDGARGVGNGLVVPAGPLRAALDFQLNMTDVVVVNESAAADTPGRVAEWFRHRFAGPVLRARVEPDEAVEWLVGARVVAWAGIGAPQRFFATLRAQGADVAEAIAFRDHQQLDPGDARRLLGAAQRHAATLVTTRKDAVRLRGTEGALGELARSSRALRIRLTLIDADAERLQSLLATALQSRRG